MLEDHASDAAVWLGLTVIGWLKYKMQIHVYQAVKLSDDTHMQETHAMVTRYASRCVDT